MSAQSSLPTGPTDWSKFREDHPSIRGMKLIVGTGIPGSGCFTDETKLYDFKCLVTTSKNNRTVDWLPPAGFSWNGYSVGRDADGGARKIIDELQLESQPVGELCLTAALRAVQTAESDASTKRPDNIEFYKRTLPIATQCIDHTNQQTGITTRESLDLSVRSSNLRFIAKALVDASLHRLQPKVEDLGQKTGLSFTCTGIQTHPASFALWPNHGKDTVDREVFEQTQRLLPRIILQKPEGMEDELPDQATLLDDEQSELSGTSV